jgi:uncharacterized lipoprotein
MKKTIPLLLGIVLLSGCSTTNITKLVQAAAKDPAKVHIEVRSPWGTITYDRDNSLAAGGHRTNVTVMANPSLLIE